MKRERDPEAAPVYRLVMEAIVLAALLTLSCVGPDVEEHNRQALREYVDGR